MTRLWQAMRFQNQIASALVIFSVLSGGALLGTMQSLNRIVALERGYDLLNVTSNLSLLRLQERLKEINLKTSEINFREFSHLFTDRTGLGTSGETYLIDHNGNLLSESRFTKTPGPAPMPENLGSFWSGIKNDYRGIPVLASWRKVQWQDFVGYVASEIDLEEIEAPLKKIRNYSLILGFCILGLGIALAPWLASILSKNLDQQLEIERVQKTSVLEGQENERKRLSLEIHDDIGQRLSALTWKLAARSDSTQDTLVEDARSLSVQLKSLVQNLSTDVLKTLGLPAALRNLVDQMNQAGVTQGLSIELAQDGEDVEFMNLRPETTVTIYRIFQEALNNILKHSRAKHGYCLLSCHSAQIEVIIEDDGVGFGKDFHFDSSRLNGLGLSNMKFRAESLGGTLNLSNRNPSGVVIKLLLPWEPQV